MADWTLEFLTREAKKGVAEPVCKETIRVKLKNELKPWKNEYWCIPPKENATFAACMEDLEDMLYIYSMPYNPEVSAICMDEMPYQLIGEVREPLAGWRHCKCAGTPYKAELGNVD